MGTQGVLRTGQGGSITVYPPDGEPKVYEPEYLDMYFEEDRVFIECIANNSPYPFEPMEAKKSLALGLAILESAQTGKTVAL